MDFKITLANGTSIEASTTSFPSYNMNKVSSKLLTTHSDPSKRQVKNQGGRRRWNSRGVGPGGMHAYYSPNTGCITSPHADPNDPHWTSSPRQDLHRYEDTPERPNRREGNG